VNGVLLLIENNDSFTMNLRALLQPLGLPIQLSSSASALQHLDNATAVVLGPGPTDPVRANLVALTQRVIDRSIPLLGVCLGHQSIALALGATVAPVVPHHGKTDLATFRQSRWMPSIFGPHQVMRYHSLAVSNVRLPLQVIAHSQDHTVMAIEHLERPVLGLQFHPDSYATPTGGQMIAAFFETVLS
jgi:anthranilate synthase/aminodeoxychorismate synthase-like glutamine amidotransferase